MTLVTVDKQSNGRRTEVEVESVYNHRMTNGFPLVDDKGRQTWHV